MRPSGWLTLFRRRSRGRAAIFRGRSLAPLILARHRHIVRWMHVAPAGRIEQSGIAELGGEAQHMRTRAIDRHDPGDVIGVDLPAHALDTAARRIIGAGREHDPIVMAARRHAGDRAARNANSRYRRHAKGAPEAQRQAIAEGEIAGYGRGGQGDGKGQQHQKLLDHTRSWNERAMKMTACPPPAQKEGWLPKGRLWRLSGANERKWGGASGASYPLCPPKTPNSSFQTSPRSRSVCCGFKYS